MKYKLLTIALLLIGMAGRAQSRLPMITDGDFGQWLGTLLDRDLALEKRLDSLTHAFQTLHDSLVELEKEQHGPFFLPPGGIQIDPGFWRPDTGWHLPPNATYVDGIYLPNGTLTDSAFKWWREHGQSLQTGSTLYCNDKTGVITSDTTISALKKKRRKG